MKKLLAVLLAVLMVFSLAACGEDKEKSEGQKVNAQDPLLGEWIAVAGNAYGIEMTYEEASAYAINVKDGGKIELIIDGESEETQWKSEDNKIIVTIKELDSEFEGVFADGTITFEDYLGLGIKLIFAKEGTPEADPGLYVPEEIKAMIGTWQSYEVKDILDEDLSETIPADSLVMDFKADYTVDIILGEDSVTGEKWVLSEGFGYLQESDYDISWDVEGDEIVVSYYDGDSYYYFTCAKAE